jgi:hypothetical protein
LVVRSCSHAIALQAEIITSARLHISKLIEVTKTTPAAKVESLDSAVVLDLPSEVEYRAPDPDLPFEGVDSPLTRRYEAIVKIGVLTQILAR